MHITTPDVSSKKATVQVKTLIKNETASPQSIILKTLLIDPNSKDAGDNQTKVELSASSEKEVTQTINVPNPFLWSPETPNLYYARVQVIKDKQVVDDTKTTLWYSFYKIYCRKWFSA